MRKAINGMRTDEAVENILNMFATNKNNQEFIHMVKTEPDPVKNTEKKCRITVRIFGTGLA